MRQARKGDLAIIAPWANPQTGRHPVTGCAAAHRRAILAVLTNPQEPWDKKTWDGFSGRVVLVKAPCNCEGWIAVNNLIPIDDRDPDAQTTRTKERERTA